ncbi:hypothetical protein Tco_1389106 [Tanacetum coccineum]
MGLLVLIEPEIPTTRGIGRKRWVGYWNLPKSPDFFEAGLQSISGQLLELLGATYSWTGKANSQFDQESLESSLSIPDQDSQLTGLELIREMTEKIVLIKNRLLTARSRQKSYTDRRSKPLEFEDGDMVLLKSRSVAYTLELPEELKGIHSTFHVSNLKKYLADENLIIPLDEIQLDDKLHFTEELVEIID